MLRQNGLVLPPLKNLTLTSGTPLVLSNLPYGKYIVREVQPDGYATVAEVDGTVSFDHRAATLTLTNTELALGKLFVIAQVLRSDGVTPVEAGRQVTVRVYGPSFDDEPNGYREMTITTGEFPPVLDGLIYGTYRMEVSEPDYTLVSLSAPVTLNIDHRADELVVVLKEKDDAKLTVSAEVLDANGDKVPDGREVTVTVHGPGFPAEGQPVTIITGDPFPVFQNLPYGEYSITANDPNYTITLPADVTLSIGNKEDTLHTVFEEKDDGKLTVSAEVLDSSGNPVPDGREVTVTVYGPSYPEGIEVTITTGQPFPVLEDLAHGEYRVEATDPNYTITLPDPVTLDIDNKDDSLHTVFKERADGKLTVSAEVLDASGNPVPDGREVMVTVYGPSYPEGIEVTITTGQPFPVLEDLVYGEYRVEAADPNYSITLPEPVTLSVDNKEDSLHTIFKEQADGKLTISAEVLDADGNKVPDGREVTVTVYGPSFPEGSEVTITIGQPFPVLEGLVPGEYRVEANDPRYTITLPDPVTLDADNKEGSLHTIFQELADGKLTISAEVLDASGNPVPDGREVTVTVYGPSFPVGREVTITTGQPFPVLEGLIYGEYRVEATDPNYIITLPDPVTLTIENREAPLHTVFAERQGYSLILGVQVYDAQGKEIRPNTTFTVWLYGPDFPGGVAFEIRPGLENAQVVDNLSAGVWRVEIRNPGAYRVVLPRSVTLSQANQTGQLIIKLYLPGPVLGNPTYHVGDAVE